MKPVLPTLPDPDTFAALRAQALVRAKLAPPVFCLMGLSAWKWGSPYGALGLKILAVVAVLHVGYLLAALFITTRPTSIPAARMVAATALLDPLLLSGWLSMLGESGALFVCFYMFTILGFGFRIGTRPMWLCQGASIAGYLAVVALSPAWAQHPIFAVSNLVLLVVVPMYATILIKKLISARAFAESESRRLAVALESAEAANQAKRRFVSSVSHELRTPLNAIIGMADLLQSTPLVEEQKDMVDSMGNASQAMLALIEDVLDFSKIEAGKATLENIALDLYQLLDETADIFKYQASQRGLSLATEIAEDVPWAVYADPRHLRQVLANLLCNAIKFTHQGGVTLRVRQISATEGEVRLHFEVEDTGIGIAVESQDKIFESFTQADELTGLRYGGTGLGTTISRQLVELMGGTLGLRSRLGAGSTFWFELTLARQPATLQRRIHGATAASASRPGARYSVLVAEDNPVNAKVIRKVLERAGHQCLMVENGGAALDQLGRGGFDAVILDMNMPVMNGLEVIKAWRSAEPAGRRTPIIMFSASVTPEVKQECMAAGADHFLAKPIQVEALLEALDVLITGSAAQPGRAPGALAASLAAAPADESAVLDFTELAKFTVLGDRAFVDDLLDTYVHDNRMRLGKLKELLVTSRFEEFRKGVHTMTGSAATLGATSLKLLCQQAEKMTDADLARSADATLAAIHGGFDQVCAAVARYRRQREAQAPDQLLRED
jgi:two-component system sensor histidine kinase RpfC